MDWPSPSFSPISDNRWMSGEPSEQKSNVSGPLEVLVGKLCFAMARTNWWEWTGWGGTGKYRQGMCWNIVILTFQVISTWRRTLYVDAAALLDFLLLSAIPSSYSRFMMKQQWCMNVNSLFWQHAGNVPLSQCPKKETNCITSCWTRGRKTKPRPFTWISRRKYKWAGKGRRTDATGTSSRSAPPKSNRFSV